MTAADAESQARAASLTDHANRLRAEGRWDEALTVCFDAYRANPDSLAAAFNLGVMLSKMGRLDEAEALVRAILDRVPDHAPSIHALAHILMGQGRYHEAWPLYDVRSRMPELKTGFPTDFAFPRWRGEPLAGKRLAIFPEQGLGDQIQFARFLPTLIAQADAVTLLAMPPLERLFRFNFPDAEIVQAAGKVEFPDPDYWTTFFDILPALDIGLENIPTAPYLRPPECWPSLGDDFKIGLKAAGNPAYLNDATRSLPAAMADRLRTGLPGRVISLEPADSGAKDMADTAAIIGQLDMVVSVDTSVAHLAGAMGKPCLLLVPGFSPDWRWMTGRSDSLWYPNHRLYRGDVSDWTPAVDRLIADARRIVGTINARAEANAAIALRDAGALDAAVAASERAVAADPRDPRSVQTHGALLATVGRLDESEALLRDLLARHPDHADSHYTMGLNLLTQGRYRDAWPHLESRFATPGFHVELRDLPYPRWQGEDLAGKRIALFPEQGFGDQIQFVRFVPELVRRGAHVTLLTPPGLVRLFARNLTGVDIVPMIGTVEFPDPDYWATLMDLPARFDLELADIDGAAYLVWDERRDIEGPGPKIGFKLTGNPKHRNEAVRSLKPDIADRLRRNLPGTHVSLEPQDSGARDFADTAAIIAGLDVVVSVDTAVAHLAGALGTPCLLLVPGIDIDWRWQHGRTDSPWYSGHRLFRGEADGDWNGAVDALIRAASDQAAAPDVIAQITQLRSAGRSQEALALAEQAAAADPDSVNLAYTEGVLLTNFGKLGEGERQLRRVMEAVPAMATARHALGVNLLAQGRYHEGWPLYQARAERSGLKDGVRPEQPCPRWQGEDLQGKRIVVLPEQGLGDQIQFVRLVPRLAAAGANVVLMASPPLADIFRESFPQVDVRAAQGNVDIQDPDFWTTLADLPVRFDTQPDQLGRDSYLRAATILPDGLREGFRIGLMTIGNPSNENDLYRSLPGEVAADLARRLSGDVVDLRPEATGARTFADTAAIIASLDIVVSVDTAVAHLAGAMGKTCLLLLSDFACDWRWERSRSDSPWYPRHKLYRADLHSGWKDAIDAVVRDAQKLSKSSLPHVRQARALRHFGRYGEAMAAGAAALKINPDDVSALHNQARLLSDLGDTDGAERIQRRLLALSPNDFHRYALGLTLLSQGRYAEAWPLYEARTQLPSLRAGLPEGLKTPRWQGEDITGKRIVLFPEQGMGDQMQFARLLPKLRERCGDIVLLAKPALVRLFEHAFPDIRIVPAAGEISFPRSDVWTTLVELARLLNLTLDTIPDAYYLDLPSHRAPDGHLRIGFMGKGNATYVHDAHRSLPPEAAARLCASLPGEVVDLDPAVTGAKDFLDTAEIIADLDLIVSVDTSVGHLAGIMAKPCCLLVSGFATDWRWLHDRTDSPWYPHHRLFRGSTDGNWDPVVADLVSYVEKLAAGSAALP